MKINTVTIRSKPLLRRLLTLAGLLLWCMGSHAERHAIPLLLPPDAPGGAQGVLRILNRAGEAGTVTIHAIDDSGVRTGPAIFTLGSAAAVEFTAAELASGNPARGLSGGIGPLAGDLRLEVETDLDIAPLAFARAADGTLSAMHDTVRGASGDLSGSASGGISGGAPASYRYEVPVFNPASDVVRPSRLRLINAGHAPAAVTIGARDDSGALAAGGDVTLTLPPHGARTLTAPQLESGDSGLTGRLGAGVGRWRLTVASDRPVQVLNIVTSPAGDLNNLSTTASPGAAPADVETFNLRFAGRPLLHRSASGRGTLSLMAGGLFSESVDLQGVTQTHTGSYDYAATGADAGRLTLAYAGRATCLRNLYFAARTAGWFASRCDSDDGPDGEWTGGSWSVEAGGDGGDNANAADETLPDVPASGSFVPAALVDGSLSATAFDTTIVLNDGGYFDLHDGTRYTCTAPGGCTIRNGAVTRGAVTRRAANSGGGAVDRFPTFRTAVGPGDRTFSVGTEIDALTLPAASGGNGPLTYTLSPSVPGLSFDPATRQVTGTPTRAGAYGMAYTVTDEDGDAATLSFSIAIEDDNDPAGHHAELTAGLPGNPFAGATVGGTEGSTRTVGTLQLGLNPNVFPVIALQGETPAVLVAASRLGNGRVVALPGQDFISPGDRATLLGNANAARLLANAVRWAGSGGDAPLRVLVDNQRIADALEAQGLEGIEVVGLRDDRGVRDWSADALDDVDVAIVLANDWGTPRLVPDSVAPLRAFAEHGGGLVVAGSALHWAWWIEDRRGPLTANLLLRGAGISWNEDSVEEIETATTDVDARATPSFVWGAYLDGEPLDPTRMALLRGAFNSALELGRTGELDTALTRLVRETPPLPTPSSDPAARLSAAVAETLGPYEWPESHAWAAVFPGEPAASARRVDGTVTLDATWNEFPADAARRERHLPLGFYAPPGALVMIEVPSEHASGELRVSVGELHDSLGLDRLGGPLREWRRAPKLRREFQVADRQTGITNAYGGSIALIVPEDYAGTIPVTVRRAIPMAVYTAGESTAAEWHEALNAGAPQAIIQKRGSIRLVISAENARGVDDPGEVQAFWDEFQKYHAELAGEPMPRGYESVWIFDPQVGYGGANANRDRINHPLYAEHWALAPGTLAGREYIAGLKGATPPPYIRPPPAPYSPETHGVDWWGFGHELGHQWQTDDWGYGPAPASREIAEVAVNLFTMYTLNFYIFGGDEFNVYAETRSHGCAMTLDHAALANLRWSTADYCEKLALYRQLIAEFGWTPIRRVFHSYYDPAYPRDTYGSKLDGFAIRFSAMIERDLVRFFRRWEYPLSDSSAAVISGFEYEEWLPPGW